MRSVRRQSHALPAPFLTETNSARGVGVRPRGQDTVAFDQRDAPCSPRPAVPKSLGARPRPGRQAPRRVLPGQGAGLAPEAAGPASLRVSFRPSSASGPWVPRPQPAGPPRAPEVPAARRASPPRLTNPCSSAKLPSPSEKRESSPDCSPRPFLPLCSPRRQTREKTARR